MSPSQGAQPLPPFPKVNRCYLSLLNIYICFETDGIEDLSFRRTIKIIEKVKYADFCVLWILLTELHYMTLINSPYQHLPSMFYYHGSPRPHSHKISVRYLMDVLNVHMTPRAHAMSTEHSMPNRSLMYKFDECYP